MLRTKPIALPDLADLEAGGQPRLLPLDSIDEDPEQPRKEFDDEALTELAETIRARGVRSPVSVRPHPSDCGRWMLNFGARRLRASRLAGRQDIPAFIDETFESYDQVIENEQREGLKPLEIALFIKRQLDRGSSRAEIARGLGKSRSYVTLACALVDAPEWLLTAYRSGKCRGMFELCELRRLHDQDPQGVEKWLADIEMVGRSELQILKERLVSRSEVAELGGASGQESTSELGLQAPHAPANDGREDERRSSGQGRPDKGPVVEPFNTKRFERRVACVGDALVLKAQFEGRQVVVVLDDVPAAAGCAYVVIEGGERVVASLLDLGPFVLCREYPG